MNIRWLVSIVAIATLPVSPAHLELVLVPVTVTDGKGATITGLEREHFTLLQDNVPQNILWFARQDVPCTVDIIVGAEGSVLRQPEAVKSVVRAFVETAAPELKANIGGSLRFERAGASAPLMDTLYRALNRMRYAHNPRRALLVVSDGAESGSRNSIEELMRLAIEADVQIYAISAGAAARSKPAEASLWEELSRKTGGRHFTAGSSSEAQKVARKAGMAVRNQYVIGYHPEIFGAAPGKWREIRVKLDLPNTNVYARNGYYSR